MFVHEFGHFIAAKMCKMRVDVFSIGMSRRVLGWNKVSGFSFGSLPEDFQGNGHTDYRLSILPFGGYVKIVGMVDESMDISYAQGEPQPWEFRSKSTPAKLFVITAGVLMNLLLAYFIFTGANFLQPRINIKTTTLGYVAPKSPAEKAGLQTNDRILNVNGVTVKYWDEVFEQMLIRNMGRSFDVKLLRGGKEIALTVPQKTFPSNIEKDLLLYPAGYVTVVDSVLKNNPAYQANIKAGDEILMINGQPLSRGQAMNVFSSSKNKTVELSVKRAKDTIQIAVTPNAAGKIGVYMHDKFTGEVAYVSNGFFESLVLGAKDIQRITVLTFQMIKNVIMRNVEFSSAFGGPIKIAQYAAKSADSGGPGQFIMFIGMLSLSLAIFNILPFPVLDGGHMIIIIIEGIIKRELPLKLKVAIQNVGFALLIILLAFIVYNDIISL